MAKRKTLQDEMARPDPRKGSSSVGTGKAGTPAAGLDPVRPVRPQRNEKLNEQIERSSSSARSGIDRFKDRDNNRKGNIRDPDPNRPDPEGVPSAGNQ